MDDSSDRSAREPTARFPRPLGRLAPLLLAALVVVAGWALARAIDGALPFVYLATCTALLGLLALALRRSRARGLEFEDAADGVFVADRDGRYLEINAAGCRMLGLPRETVVGRSILDFLPAQEVQRVAAAREALFAGRVHLDEWVLRRADGTTLAVEISARLLSGGRWQALVRDISERRRIQERSEERLAELTHTVDVRTEELELRQALMHAVVEAAVDAILTIDERGLVQSLNPSAERMFGYRSEEVIGRNVSLLMPFPFREQHDGYLAAYLSTGERRIIGIGREVTARHRDGTEIPVHLSVSEVRLAGRRLFTGFLHDLSARKQLERELVAAQKLELVGRFSGSLAHDFNNLLMGIQACSTVAAGELPRGAPARKALEEIGAATRRGVALTKRLLAFGRRNPVEPHATNLDDVVRANEPMLRQLLGEDVALWIEHPVADVHARADEGRIEQILINLLVNSRDAMPAGGRIRVTLRRLGGEVELAVADSGAGIPPELRERIFEPFFTTKSADKGTGLGLATVRRIVEDLRGRIELESEPSVGTTFRVFLPACAAPAPVAPAPADAPVAPCVGRTVLLVEDDRLIRASLRNFLSSKGHRVLVAGSPSAALQKAMEETALDVLVTDVVLPEYSGGELAARLRARLPALEVIFMSANPAELLIEQGRLQDAERYLEKPFEPEALERMLDKVFATSR